MNIEPSVPKTIAGLMNCAEWQAVLDAWKRGTAPDAEGYVQAFSPLCAPERQTFVGQLGQSIDGRIATATGDSFYINCQEALDHLHCLRALCDAVVVGVGTVVADNPQLTVRRVPGESASRVIIDPNGRIPKDACLLHDEAAPTIVLTRDRVTLDLPAHVEVRRLPEADDGRLCCHAIAEALSDFKRILIEGGACTVSRFIDCGLLDRLHVMVAPLIIGAGPTGIQLPPLDKLSEAHRPMAAMHQLGTDWLLDLDLKQELPH
ncbi:RibD family protein [Pseudovibrio sp. SPO723]|uniref:RibD family protein n=1 Tax=Nesiotobacter zosterae TaxID=392721 RepID=UPI0029C4D39F|nr:RibD family protein [Pseudovibrio sp. SPO723]MDX5592236.1 RibD family protein [Pseudovibrio sp. SPO723]